jgi:hypothetical protein
MHYRLFIVFLSTKMKKSKPLAFTNVCYLFLVIFLTIVNIWVNTIFKQNNLSISTSFFFVETLVIDEIVIDGTSGMTILPTNGLLNIKLWMKCHYFLNWNYRKSIVNFLRLLTISQYLFYWKNTSCVSLFSM